MCDDLVELCSACAEIHGRVEHNLIWSRLSQEIGTSYLLHEDEHFVVIPGAGAIVPGYVLVIPRVHVLSTGYLPLELREHFNALILGVGDWCAEEFGLEPHVFEHGALNFTERGGSCSDHAHVQVAPVGPTSSFVDNLAKDFDSQVVDDHIAGARELVAEGSGTAYLYTWSPSFGAALAPMKGGRSQYFRRLLAAHVGREHEWDGPVFPFVEHMRETLDVGQRMSAYVSACLEQIAA